MATYMVQFKYTDEGMRGLLKEGGSKRREAVEQLGEALGGKVVAFYFAFGEYDGLAIVEGTGNVEMVASNLIVANTGTVTTKTTVLLTPEELDQAVQITAPFRAAGT